MHATTFRAALQNLDPYEVALAFASANRILIELLVKTGVARSDIEALFREKAQELIAEDGEDNAANLLRMASVVSSQGRQGA